LKSITATASGYPEAPSHNNCPAPSLGSKSYEPVVEPIRSRK